VYLQVRSSGRTARDTQGILLGPCDPISK
jgi:hypothetical protein